ncbi:MAG TPA: hypothetical protein VGP99_08205, partial [Tepidisphaeraceae bacterium]|nr:hypothetical protein [Tepidisphaeraceae bacterium]
MQFAIAEAGGRWVCFVKNFAWQTEESGVFGALEWFWGLKGGFDWLCSVDDAVGGLWIVGGRAGE